MTILLTDNQIVGESETTLLQLKGSDEFSIILKNSGVNTMNYRIEQYNGSAWSSLGASGTDYYNTLTADQVKSIKVDSDYPTVRIVGNASGGAFLEFSAMAEVTRPSGGSFTVLPV